MIRNPVNFEPLSDSNIEAVSVLKVKPFQQIFTDKPANILATQEEGISVHVIKKNDSVVGMFCVDTQFHIKHMFAQSDTPGIRSLIIDEAKQGQGLGTEACRMMPFYLRSVIPLSRGIYQMVQVKNAGAHKCSTRAGWIDTQEKYMLSHTGPQHILWMPLR
jgi:hypothetical protein